MAESWKLYFLGILDYNIPKTLVIRNKTFGLAHRFLQLGIFAFIIGYFIVWNKGYQIFGDIESAVVTKVKGVAYPNFTDDDFNPEIRNFSYLYRRIWDVADYIVPSSENSAFFITTNILITGDQTQSSCPEDYKINGALCTKDSDCERGSSLTMGNGVFTGNCVQSDVNSSVTVCEILGWCPVERDINALLDHKAVLSDAKNFTVLIKNFVNFPKFGVKRRNIPKTASSTYLKNCRYNAETDPLCPVFVIGDIVDDFDHIAEKGGVIAVAIKWDCDFDFKESYCIPTYSFSRLDENNSPLAPGFNFRHAHYYSDTKRTLFKVYGIEFAIQTQGMGGKWNTFRFLFTLGSTFGLMTIGTVACDLLLLHMLRKKGLLKDE